MRLFSDASLPLAIGVGVGLLCAIRGFTVLQTLGFVTVFYSLWKVTMLWSRRHGR